MKLPSTPLKTTVIRNQQNLGISESRNVGFRTIDSTFVLFINCGITIPEQWLECVLDRMRVTGAGAVTTRVVSHSMKHPLTKWRFRFLENPHTIDRREAKIDWMIGHVMMIRCQAVHAIGGFRSDYRLSREDGDVSLKLWKRGFEIWQVDGPDAVCHQIDTIDVLARKAIRNQGWNLSLLPYPGSDLKTLEPVQALRDQNRFLRDRLRRNFLKGRFLLLVIDIIVWRKSVTLIRNEIRYPSSEVNSCS